MTVKSISGYSAKFQNDVISTQQDYKDAKRKFKDLPSDASDEDKRKYRVRMENAGIDYEQALKQYAHEFYADLQSWKHGNPPKTKTNLSKDELDDIIKKTDQSIKNPNNKQMYNNMFPFLAEAVTLVGPHSVAQIKKKRHFEFKEESNESWKELEHYLYEDATKSGQKSDTVGNPEFKSFTHSSSFVGNVLWDRESREMDIILNDKKYHFCNVSERLFDSFEGSDSKGSFFNRRIKGQFDC